MHGLACCSLSVFSSSYSLVPPVFGADSNIIWSLFLPSSQNKVTHSASPWVSVLGLIRRPFNQNWCAQLVRIYVHVGSTTDIELRNFEPSIAARAYAALLFCLEPRRIRSLVTRVRTCPSPVSLVYIERGKEIQKKIFEKRHRGMGVLSDQDPRCRFCEKVNQKPPCNGKAMRIRATMSMLIQCSKPTEKIAP